ncbi:hypothetical protein R75461_07636 [Paraburkholderia nemoris]|uniref:inner membrane protein YiaA n=1 Tax=Paraburkholderia nemoris TaxID=2793076 RepID=UPI00190C0A9A|nr:MULTISPECIES: inner membrane protein YiaA [Paraburkholderia]MBK3786414.1 hypothetical protein [Paraburkholderia aspalathi]CAE6854431.1 hypothetical protein R75461_07636 [Paraburkholderia nemoris]
MKSSQLYHRPSFAFVSASWTALLVGVIAYVVGLWNASMQLNEKGYYFAVLVLALFAAVSLQKSVRDRLEGIPVTNIYYGLAWSALIIGVLLLCIGLFNASLALSEKGFYGMSFALSVFSAIAVQKNTRDIEAASAADIRGEQPFDSRDGGTPLDAIDRAV